MLRVVSQKWRVWIFALINDQLLSYFCVFIRRTKEKNKMRFCCWFPFPACLPQFEQHESCVFVSRCEMLLSRRFHWLTLQCWLRGWLAQTASNEKRKAIKWWNKKVVVATFAYSGFLLVGVDGLQGNSVHVEQRLRYSNRCSNAFTLVVCKATQCALDRTALCVWARVHTHVITNHFIMYMEKIIKSKWKKKEM